MTSYPNMATVEVGDELPVMHKRAEEAELFLYSAASFNPHRIHYDRAYANYEGHEDIVVHGPLQGSWLTQFITDWAGPNARLLSVQWQNRASAFVAEELRFSGSVISVDQVNSSVELEIYERKEDGSVLMPAKATVKLEQS
ncbi:MAG: MaoC/PaaZ C-terminal domain-containing protein [Candidatus Poriferisodalaceae bacterium]|nr:MAG: acyl dehydratase [Acidimicrobiales bacterium MED-G01]